MKYLYTFFVLSLVSFVFFNRCSSPHPTPTPEDDTIYLSGTMEICDTMIIEKGTHLVIKAGSHLTFCPGALIKCYGQISLLGTESSPILLTAIDPLGDHRILWVKPECDTFTMTYTTLIDGLSTSSAKNNYFDHCTFRNSKGLAWDNAAARFWNGNILITNCTIDWNNQGEGFLIHNVNSPEVRNCTFIKVPDAVEFSSCPNGIVSNCVFRDMNDDAIDNNNCYKTLIQNNKFFNVKDRALELGSENFGPSSGLMVTNNLFVNCNIAVDVKESSDAIVDHCTFYGNTTDLEVISDPGNDPSILLVSGSVLATQSQFSQCNQCILDVRYCASTFDLHQASSNTKGEITFKNVAEEDFTLISAPLPEGYSLKTLGFQPQ